MTTDREWFDATYKRLLNDHSHMADLVREACLRGIAAIEASGEARPTPVEPEAPSAALETLLLAAEEVDNSWYDDEGTVRWHEELWDRLVALRKAHNAFERWELAGGRLAVEPDGLPLDVERRWAYEAAMNVVREVHPDCASLGTLDKMAARLASTPSEAKP